MITEKEYHKAGLLLADLEEIDKLKSQLNVAATDSSTSCIQLPTPIRHHLAQEGFNWCRLRKAEIRLELDTIIKPDER
jgi:hypothetical protein